MDLIDGNRVFVFESESEDPNDPGWFACHERPADASEHAVLAAVEPFDVPAPSLGYRHRCQEYRRVGYADSKLSELTSLLCTEPGQDPVERAKALVSIERRLKRSSNFAGTPGDKLDEELQQADDAAERAGFDHEQLTPAQVIDSLRDALAEKDAALSNVRAILDSTQTAHEVASKLAHSRGIELDRLRERVAALIPELREAWRLTPPHEMVLHCPNCGKQHLDIGEFATRVHRKHKCVDSTEGPDTGCGHEWEPFTYATKGVEFTVTQAAFAIGQERDQLRSELAKVQERSNELEDKFKFERESRIQIEEFRRKDMSKACEAVGGGAKTFLEAITIAQGIRAKNARLNAELKAERTTALGLVKRWRAWSSSVQEFAPDDLFAESCAFVDRLESSRIEPPPATKAKGSDVCGTCGGSRMLICSACGGACCDLCGGGGCPCPDCAGKKPLPKPSQPSRPRCQRWKSARCIRPAVARVAVRVDASGARRIRIRIRSRADSCYFSASASEPLSSWTWCASMAKQRRLRTSKPGSTP